MADVDTVTGAQDLAGAETEEAADFARLEAMAGAGVEVLPGAEPEPEPVPSMDAAESMAGLLVAVSSVAGYVGFKNVAGLWTPEACGACAEKSVPVLRKYPWGVRVLDFFETGAGAEELALGAFLLPMGAATWQAVKADMAANGEEGKRKAAGPVKPVDTSGTVTVKAPDDLGGMVEVNGRINVDQ